MNFLLKCYDLLIFEQKKLNAYEISMRHLYNVVENAKYALEI